MSHRSARSKRSMAVLKHTADAETNKRPLVLLLCAIIITSLAYGISYMPNETNSMKPIEHVRVSGELKWVGKDELKTTLKKYLRSGFFDVDVNAIKMSLEQLPWVKSASVRRVWPDSLSVSITEHSIMARWGEKAVIDDAGEIIYIEFSLMPKGLTQIIGPESLRKTMFRQFVEIKQLLKKVELNMDKMIVNNRHSLVVETDSGFKLLLGRMREYTDSALLVAKFVKVYSSVLEKKANRILAIDLRYTNGLSVQWKDVPIAKDVENSVVGNLG